MVEMSGAIPELVEGKIYTKKPIDIGVKPLFPGHFLLNQYHRHSYDVIIFWNIPKYMPLLSGVTYHIFPATNPLTSSQIISNLSG